MVSWLTVVGFSLGESTTASMTVLLYHHDKDGLGLPRKVKVSNITIGIIPIQHSRKYIKFCLHNDLFLY